jgi:hypothetical protein
MDCEHVSKAYLHFSKGGRPLEQSALGFGPGDFCVRPGQPRITLALLAVMMCKQNPLDLLYANFIQVLQDSAIAQIDHQRQTPIADDINVAGIIRPHKQVRRKAAIHQLKTPGTFRFFCCGTYRRSCTCEYCQDYQV